MRLPVLSLLLVATTPAFAFTTGVSGHSGKSGSDCATCHGGSSAAPRATISGPDVVAPGTSATFQLVVDTDVNSAASAKRAVGIDIATGGGTLGTVVQTNATRLLNGEISHTDALPQSKSVAVSFLLNAPMEEGPLVLFAAALSADGNGGEQGDATAVTQRTITIGPVPLVDLGVVDAMSAATSFMPTVPPDMGPPKDEATWGCSTSGASEGGASGLALLLALGIGRRLRRLHPRLARLPALAPTLALRLARARRAPRR